MQVELIDFSPGERDLKTYRNHKPSNPRDKNVMGDFKGSADESAFGGTGGVAGVYYPVSRIQIIDPKQLQPFEDGIMDSQQLLSCFMKENMQRRLTDENVRDQFVIHAGLDTEVFLNDARQKKPDPVLVYKQASRKRSQLGSCLAKIHGQGAAACTGASILNLFMRYAYPQVELIDFSPGEKDLVTYRSHKPSNPRDKNRVVIGILDVRTGKLMGDFKGSADESAFGGTGGVVGVYYPVSR